jgi:uncharacterized surface protein with fasciclin (FAS1) repeats
MKILATLIIIAALAAAGCGPAQDSAPASEAPAVEKAAPEPVSNIPPLDPTNIVSIAVGSKDHSTLVAAIQAADYVTSVAASGPLTVFAPTNDAFAALPAGTLDTLLEPQNVDQLREILKYHVTTSALTTRSFRDGQSLGMANGAKPNIRVSGDEVTINGAKVVASVPASNGIVHVIDAVLLPPDEG